MKQYEISLRSKMHVGNMKKPQRFRIRSKIDVGCPRYEKKLKIKKILLYTKIHIGYLHNAKIANI